MMRRGLLAVQTWRTRFIWNYRRRTYPGCNWWDRPSDRE